MPLALPPRPPRPGTPARSSRLLAAGHALDEALAGGADQERHAEAVEQGDVGEQRQVMGERLAEAYAGSAAMRARSMPALTTAPMRASR